MMSPFSRLIPFAAALITIATVLAGVFTVNHLNQERLVQRSRSQTLDQLSIVRGRIESALNARIFLGRGLVAYASTHPNIAVPEFQLFVAALIRQQSGIRSIQLAKGSTVSHIYPLKGNEAALGLKLLDIPEQRDAVQQAIASRNTIVAGPVDLVQGGRAFISRTPIFLSPPGGEPGSGAYWGLATIIIDMAPLFEEAGLSQDFSTLNYALRGKDGKGAGGEAFWGDPELFREDSVRLDITLPNGSWQIAAMPVKKSAADDSAWLWQSGILLALVAGILAWFLARNPARLHRLVQQTTCELREAHADLEIRVAERTTELRLSNDKLKSEITERRRAKDSLHNQLLFTQALFEAIPSPVFFKNKKGEYLGCNQEFETAFGLSRQEIKGKTAYDIMPKDLADIYYAMDEALFREPGRQVYESQVGLADGTRRNVIFNKATFTDANGELSGLVGVILDITERKQMEEALRRAHNELEERVRERTTELARINHELTSEIAERKRLEQQIIEISEAEQKRIGQELHDGLGQHLTGVAFLSKALEQKLAARALPETTDATEIVRFLNQAVSQTRTLARGLFPVELENNGLMSALEHLAAGLEKLFGIACVFRCKKPVLVHDRITAINLYRIAQEALANAARHGKASNILLELTTDGDRIHLAITDDGTGLDPHGEHQGMGLHIMRYRANMLGASLNIQSTAGGGTEVRVSLNQ